MSDSLPDWQVEALRRFRSPESLIADEDLADIVERVLLPEIQNQERD